MNFTPKYFHLRHLSRDTFTQIQSAEILGGGEGEAKFGKILKATKLEKICIVCHSQAAKTKRIVYGKT